MPNRTPSKRSEIRARNRRTDSRQRNVAILIVAAFALVVAFLLIWPNIRPVGDVKMP